MHSVCRGYGYIVNATIYPAVRWNIATESKVVELCVNSSPCVRRGRTNLCVSAWSAMLHLVGAGAGTNVRHPSQIASWHYDWAIPFEDQCEGHEWEENISDSKRDDPSISRRKSRLRIITRKGKALMFEYRKRLWFMFVQQLSSCCLRSFSFWVVIRWCIVGYSRGSAMAVDNTLRMGFVRPFIFKLVATGILSLARKKKIIPERYSEYIYFTHTKHYLC